MVSVLSSPSLYAFTGGEAPSLEGLRERYRSQIAGPTSPAEIWMNWIIRAIAHGRAVGFLQADIIGHNAELAWVVSPDHQGNGLASEAASGVAEWLSTQGVSSFSAHIRSDHAASQAVAANLGLTNTGTLDQDGEQIWQSM